MSDGAQPEQIGGNESGPEKESKSRPVMRTPSPDLFVLEDAFPDAQTVFSTSIVRPIDQCDALVVIDTNALLLRYRLAGGELASLKETYEKLADQSRLFIPARVAREFIANRDKRLAELIQSLLNDNSRVSPAFGSLPAHLRSVPGYLELMKAGEDLDAARKAYQKAVATVQSAIAMWRGDDPVTMVYSELFKSSLIVEHDGDRDELATEWTARLKSRVPPGFKDGNKDDSGIGDFLIWKTILRIGRQLKKDLVFVTGEEKTDWMIRSNNRGVYPRPELVVEYRRASLGKSIRFSTLSHLLEEMKAPAEVIREVTTAEDMANLEAQATVNVLVQPSGSSRHWSEIHTSFLYATNDGNLTITTSVGKFEIRFSKCSDNFIYLIKTGSTARIARAKGVLPRSTIVMDVYDTTSSTYTIGLGEVFLVENASGDLLVGRVTHIADDTRGNATADVVQFTYSTWRKGNLAIAP